jgi:hypothetical protein
MLQTEPEIFDSLCDQLGCRLLVPCQIHATLGDFRDSKPF